MGGFLFPDAGAMPAVPPPLPSPPSRSSPEVQAAADADRKRRRAMLGRSSTQLTGDLGVPGAAPVRRALLGGTAQATGA